MRGLRQDIKDFLKDVLVALALVGFAIAIVTCTGCTSLALEYEHVSHPMAGPPFGPSTEEDWIDQVNACATRRTELSERLNAYGTSCVGYVLTDGGFYGPELTGTLRAGIEFSLRRSNSTRTLGEGPSSHNALGGYRKACGNLPGMVGDDC